jgi:hypothetical protein
VRAGRLFAVALVVVVGIGQLAGALAACDLVREARQRRAYDDYQRSCQAYARTLFPQGEVDPRAWCEP